jgi:hypothetical protein
MSTLPGQLLQGVIDGAVARRESWESLGDNNVVDNAACSRHMFEKLELYYTTMLLSNEVNFVYLEQPKSRKANSTCIPTPMKYDMGKYLAYGSLWAGHGCCSGWQCLSKVHMSCGAARTHVSGGPETSGEPQRAR